MDKKFFSPSMRAFFAEEFMDAYIANGTCPDDLVELTEQEYATYSDTPPWSMELGVGDEGKPIWVESERQKVPLSVIKNDAIRAINSTFRSKLDKLTADYPPAETASFDRQEREAVAYKESKDGSDAPLLTAIANGRGVKIDWLVDKVLSKADEYSLRMGELAGKRQRLVSLIETAKTMEEVKSIKWGSDDN